MLPHWVKVILIMFLIGTIICVVLFMIIQTFIHELQSRPSSSFKNDSNLTLSSLFDDSVLENWLSNSPKSTPWKIPAVDQTLLEDPSPVEGWSNSSRIPKEVRPNVVTEFPVEGTERGDLSNSTYDSLQNDDSSAVSKEYFVESLFRPPSVTVEPDWSVVLGTFDHFGDENWKSFLIKTEVPLLVRMFLSDSSETVTISRISKEKKKDIKGQGKKPVSPKEAVGQSAHEMLIETASWLLTVNSQFTLGKPYIEHDLDGTDSMNTFFFTTPRLLVHNKIKDKWRTAIIRHFDEKGLNMTFVDRDRILIARRFFNRID